MTQTLERFPDDVIVALHNANVTLSCIPVQIDHGEWTAALFFVVPADAACLANGKLDNGPFAVSFEADLHEHEKGTLVELAIEVATSPEPCHGMVMFLTGHSSAHFDTLKLLTERDEVMLFLGNEYCEVLWQQRVPLSDVLRSGLRSLLDEAVGKDAIIRMTGHYDPDTAFADVLARTGVQ